MTDDSEKNPTPAAPSDTGEDEASGILKHFRSYFLTGIVLTAPIGITFYIIWVLVDFTDGLVRNFLPTQYDPATYLGFNVFGVGLLVVVIVVTLLGALTANIFGRYLIRSGEWIVNRTPVIRSIYSTLKQIFETVISQSSSSFREVVLVEYPRHGIWAIAFVTGLTKGEIQRHTEQDTVNIFLPTTPNPTSGFLLFVPRRDLIFLDMTIEEGFKHVISAGVVTPKDSAHAETPDNGPNGPALPQPD